MEIRKSKNYLKDYQKKLVRLHKNKEIQTIESIETLIINSINLKELLQNPLHIVYGIEQKHGDLKEIFTAKINNKLRLRMRPVGEYPYNLVEIEAIEFCEIDDKHYGEG
ncbi:MAG: hypothetical protein IKI57_07200 [Clostridia bacterium]|nr:hypothetical protein [Clostridia bacterium]